MTKKNGTLFSKTPHWIVGWVEKNGTIFYFWPVGWMQSWSSQIYVWKCLLDGWMGQKKREYVFFWPVGWLDDQPGLIYVWKDLLDGWMTSKKTGHSFRKHPIGSLEGTKKNGTVFYFWPVGWIQSWSSQICVWKCLLDGLMGQKKREYDFFLACWMV